MRQKDLTLYRGDTTSFPFLVSNIDPGDFSSLTIRMEAQRQDTFETVIGFNILSSDPGNNWASNQVQANLTPGMSQGIDTDQTILLKYDLEVSRNHGSGMVVTTEYFGTIELIPDVTVGNPVINPITEVNIRSDFASTADSLGASLVGVKASLWNSIASNVQQALEWLLNNRLNAPSPWNTNRIIKTGSVAPDTIATGVSIDSSNNITGANRVTSASAPTNPQDLARKDYVDQSTEQFLLSLSPIAGQYLTFDGANFDFLIPPTAPVTSVNGQTGVVSLDTDDVPEGSRLYFTEERVDDRVNNLLVAGANITLTYDDPSNSLTIAAASGSGSIPDGTAALPGLAFTSDPDTGLYIAGANILGVAVGGVKVGEFNSNGYQGLDNVLIVIDQKTAGTNGGTFTSGARRTRDLNTVRVNRIAGASLSSNQITLPAGTYRVEAYAPAQMVGAHQAYLRDITASADLVIGHSAFSDAFSTYATTESRVADEFTLAVTSVIELQHQCGATKSTDGFGVANGFGAINIYSYVFIRRIA